MKPASKEAYQLMHEGVLALAGIERAGIRVDTVLLTQTIDKVSARIDRLKARLKRGEVYAEWRKRYGENTNITSRPQLAEILFNCMGVERPAGRTTTGRTRMDVAALEGINHPFIVDYLEIQKLEKLLGTYLKGVQKHVVDGYIHPNYCLHTAVTYRGSCLEPNFQNIPVRDPVVGKLIRRCFVSRRGYQLLENDFKGAEICTAACYHKDKNMLHYLSTGYDMHTAMASECYKLPMDDIPKMMRFAAKSYFVFAEFYGDWYPKVARNLWEGIKQLGLERSDGVCLYEHLQMRGIECLGMCDPKVAPVPGTFEHHIKQVEQKFWDKRFPGYKRWKNIWHDEYLRKGYFRTLTGFVCQGVYTRNQVVNSPIQGSAFHCLLWCLIRLTRQLRKRRMRTCLIGQIHDSILSDVYVGELDDYIEMVKQVVEVDLPKAWPWIITPMRIEAELSPPGGSWYGKKEIEI